MHSQDNVGSLSDQELNARIKANRYDSAASNEYWRRDKRRERKQQVFTAGVVLIIAFAILAAFIYTPAFALVAVLGLAAWGVLVGGFKDRW